MGLTIAQASGEPYTRRIGDEYETQKTIAFDSSYPTGGEAFTAVDLGFSVLPRWISIEPKSGYVFEVDRTNLKIIVYWGDNNNASDAPMVEVADTTSLATLTGVRVLSRGKYPA